MKIKLFLLVWEYLILEDKYNKLNKAEFDCFWNVISYRINFKTHDFDLDKKIKNRQERIKKEIKNHVWYWNYLLFIWNRSYFIKKFKL